MPEQELLKQIESSEALRQAREKLLSEVSFRAGPSARFDPITIIMLISVIVQVLKYCRERRKPADIIADIRNARTLPRLRTRRLRRNLAELSEKLFLQDSGTSSNLFFDAAVDAAESASDEEIAEIMRLAAEE
jgi:hypothetical protein